MIFEQMACQDSGCFYPVCLPILWLMILKSDTVILNGLQVVKVSMVTTQHFITGITHKFGHAKIVVSIHDKYLADAAVWDIFFK